MRRLSRTFLPLAAALALAGAGAGAAELETGAELFAEYCAQCHGVDGSGEGEGVEFTDKAPGDLRMLAALNAGAFPLARVVDMIDGRERLEMHEQNGMPAWGEVFRFDEEAGDALAHARILNLVLFLYAIQEE